MNWDTFAGMVPADDPQFVVAIMVDNPAHGVEGGDVAAPLFHQIADLRAAARAHPADRIAVDARAAAGLRGVRPRVRCPLTSADVAPAFEPTECPAPGRRRAPCRTGSLRRRIAGAGRGRSGTADASPASPASSDRVRPGDLFAALPGARATAPRFAAGRGAAGAVAVLTDAAGARRRCPPASRCWSCRDVRAVLGPGRGRGVRRPERATLRMLGVTGTSGKTTTTFLRARRPARGRARRRADRHGRHPDRRRTTVKTGFTTPEAPDLQALLAVMVERGVTDVAMEVSSHALAWAGSTASSSTSAAFTNLSQDHLDFHADMEDYFAAKALLFDGRAARDAVVVVDDEWGRRLARRSPARSP